MGINTFYEKNLKNRRGRPLNNRPSTNLLWHFEKKSEINMWLDKWQLTFDMWHGTHDTYGILCQVPSSYGFGILKSDMWEVSVLTIDNIFLLLGERLGTIVVKGGKRKVQVISKCIYIPLAEPNYLVSFNVFYHQ